MSMKLHQNLMYSKVSRHHYILYIYILAKSTEAHSDMKYLYSSMSVEHLVSENCFGVVWIHLDVNDNQMEM